MVFIDLTGPHLTVVELKEKRNENERWIATYRQLCKDLWIVKGERRSLTLI